jgi:hypothetical protein
LNQPNYVPVRIWDGRDAFAFANVNNRVQRLDSPTVQLIEKFLEIRHRKRRHHSAACSCAHLLQDGEMDVLKFSLKMFPDPAMLSFFKWKPKRFPIKFSQLFGVG